MKIWLAKMVLREIEEDYAIDDQYYIPEFTFEYLNDNYEVSEYDKDEWTSSSKTFFGNTVSSDIEIVRYYDYSAIQGFDRELNKAELEEVEQQMRKELHAYIQRRMNVEMNMYKLMLKPLEK